MDQISNFDEQPDDLSVIMEVNIHTARCAARLLHDEFLAYVLGMAAAHLAELRCASAELSTIGTID